MQAIPGNMNEGAYTDSPVYLSSENKGASANSPMSMQTIPT